MKKTICILIVVLILFAAIPVTLASATVTVDKSTALPGDTVTISGMVDSGSSIVVKVTDESGNIVFFDAAKTDANGKYAVPFTMPSDMAPGKLTVTAGSGSDIATTTITVSAPPSTPTPTSSASPSPSSSASVSPSSSASTDPSSSASADPSSSASADPSPSNTDDATPTDTNKETPTSTEDARNDLVVPKEITKDEDTGVISIVIDVTNLPEGTVAIQAPDGEILYISDAKDGVIVVEVIEDDIGIDGQVGLVALDDELTPQAALRIQVLDGNKELVISNTGDTGGSAWIVIVCIAAGVIILAIVAWILFRKRNKQAQDS